MNLRRQFVNVFVTAVFVAALSVACVAQSSSAGTSENPKVQPESTAQFQELGVLPVCMTFSVERGDPFTGPSLLLIKATKGCVVPWHWHTAREELMLVNGTGKIEMTNFPAHQVQPGGYVLLPAKHHHQFTCQTACVLFDAIAGKFDIHYVDKSGNEIPVQQALTAVSEKPGVQK